MKIALIVIGILVVILGGWYVFSFNKKPIPEETVSALFSCNEGESITAVFHNTAPRAPEKAGEPPIPTGSVNVTLSDGRAMALMQTISASGVRYADSDESFVFWNKGRGALVLENNEQKSYIGCVEVVPQPVGSDLSQVYSNQGGEFSVRYPKDWTADATYHYTNLGPEEPKIYGVKFSVSDLLTKGTNLSSDTGISVEEMPNMLECTAYPFLISPTAISKETIDGTAYSVARASDAAAGNRYEETVYALVGTNPCIAVRYFIHYGAIENYPEGAVTEFDATALRSLFGEVRKTLIINQ